MLEPDLVIRSRRVATPDGIVPATLVVAGGRIVEVAPHDGGPEPHGAQATGAKGRDAADRHGADVTSTAASADATGGARVVDVGDLVVLPGLVDSHVHVNEPGRTHWEGFASATRAAAAGGITTLVDMPLNSIPPTTTLDALERKREVAAPQLSVDVAFWGGAVPDNREHLGALLDAGVRGFKAFLCDSGVEEYRCLDPGGLGPLTARLAELGATLLVHAEDADILAAATTQVAADLAAGRRDPRHYSTWLDSRPPDAEVRAVESLVTAMRDAIATTTASGTIAAGPSQARAHVLHLSAASAGAVVAEARAAGVPITAETCPHYLTLAAEDVAAGATDHKCAPPIRDRANQDRLWELLRDGTIDAIVSDHSPCPLEDKALDSGDFMAAWGGIASLQLGLPLVWTAARTRGFGLEDVVGWMASAPARIAGLGGKGAIVAGADADLVVFDPDALWTIDRARMHHRHPVTPYHGREVVGAVRATYLGGVLVARNGEVVAAGRGRMLGDPAPSRDGEVAAYGDPAVRGEAAASSGGDERIGEG